MAALSESREIRLLALGQSLIEHDLREHPYPGFRPLCERLQRADLRLSNLEGALRGLTAAAPTRQGMYFHATPPQTLDCLRDMSIDLLPLASNHTFDLGVEGIQTTLEETRRRGFITAGIGMNLAAAAAPNYGTFAGAVIALVAFASKVPEESRAEHDRPGVNHLCLTSEGEPDREDATRILDSIRRAAQQADLVIAYQHDHYWASNRQVTPHWKQGWARECIDAGANAYISHGVPLVHGIEIYHGSPIFFGLGNFIFHTKTPVGHYEPAAWESVTADCLFHNGKLADLSLEPIVLNESGASGDAFFETRGRPTLTDGPHAHAILKRVQRLSEPFGTRIEIREGFAKVQF